MWVTLSEIAAAELKEVTGFVEACSADGLLQPF
jgi:hypothetical protein